MRVVWTIVRKEVALFFNSLIAYIVMAVFLTGVGLFFWVFPGNLLDTGAAGMDALFTFAPWFFLFIVPALTMRAFAEEFKTGSIEFLATKPVTDWQIILGKYLAAAFLVAATLAPSLVYFISVYALAMPTGDIDTGAIVGAYLGLLGVGWVFAAVGLFASTLTDSQIVAFVIGVFLCFFLFAAFDFLSELPVFGVYRDVLMKLGVNDHYRSISRGVVDTRDVLYYLTVIFLFLLYSKAVLTAKKKS